VTLSLSLPQQQKEQQKEEFSHEVEASTFQGC